jgi:hypothetical protein
VGAGLGGGSADAAAILRWAGCSDLEMASALGADVPFCVAGGRARVRGIGESVTALAHQDREFTLLLPPFGMDTAAVYRAWDRYPRTGRRETIWRHRLSRSNPDSPSGARRSPTPPGWSRGWPEADPPGSSMAGPTPSGSRIGGHSSWGRPRPDCCGPGRFRPPSCMGRINCRRSSQCVKLAAIG